MLQSERKIRIFISSTFRDMMMEREYLLKRIFPQLHRWCIERHIEMTEVDLRWGITEEEAKEGKVIEYLVEFFGEFKFYKAVLNNKVDSLNETYTEYISQTLIEDNFKSLVSDFDKIYEAYLKNKDKVFFVDSLYYYQQLDYYLYIICHKSLKSR